MKQRFFPSFLCGALAFTSLAAHAAGELNLYNWSDYVDPATVAAFSKQYDIKVNTSYYDSNATLQAKILTGHSGYDLVVPSQDFIGHQVQAGAYQKIDKTKLPNYREISPKLLELLKNIDPNNDYAVPYFWGINTVGINVDQVKAALGDMPMPKDTWALVFDPKYAAKLQGCGITLLDAPDEVFPMYAKYAGINPNTQSLDDVKKIYAGMQKIVPYVKRFTSDGYINMLANGNACVSLGYGGDLNMAKTRAEAADNGVHIAVLVPQTGVAVWVDSFAIPKDAQNVDNALAYINWTLAPKVAAQNGDYVTYAPASDGAKQYMEKAYVDDPSIFPTPEVLKNSFIMKPESPQVLKAQTRYWQRLKAG